MDQRACEKCGETVSAAKAFCPSCGHAFVEEETREETSEFQQLDGTMQVGKTMYNQMLSEMGLNIAELTERPPEPVTSVPETVSPPAEPQRPVHPVKAEVIKPITTERLASAVPPAAAPPKDRTKLLIVIGSVIIAGWVLLLLLFAFFAILPRLR